MASLDEVLTSALSNDLFGGGPHQVGPSMTTIRRHDAVAIPHSGPHTDLSTFLKQHCLRNCTESVMELADALTSAPAYLANCLMAVAAHFLLREQVSDGQLHLADELKARH